MKVRRTRAVPENFHHERDRIQTEYWVAIHSR